MLPKTRLGKRSPMGALVSAPCLSTEPAPEAPGHPREQEPSPGGGPGPQPLGRVKLYPGQKVYVLCGGRECVGLVEQHNHVDNEVSVLLTLLGQHVLRKLEDVWTTPSSQHPAHLPHPVSSCIDVPKGCRNPEGLDMDEMIAALVLTSLSCSPQVQSPPRKERVPTATGGVESGGGELSDSSSSGYWSWDRGNGSPAPSPPIAETDSSLATPPDEDMDMELVLFEEPAPRKRKNSMKLAYRCLWPSCGKELTSVVGIKRHIRTLHLGHTGELDREEDFYYSEIHDHSLTPPPGASPPSPPQQAESALLADPPAPSTPGASHTSLLSQSAPGCFWQVHSEHSYQAPPPVQVVVPPPVVVAPSCRWTPPPVTAHPTKQAAPFRSRSVSVGEQWLQNHSAPLRPLPSSASPPRTHCVSRRIRGEAKKCRKVYGIEHRDQWCTACRWKKACQRFLD